MRGSLIMSIEYTLLFSLACLATLILSPRAARISLALGALDRPSEGVEGGSPLPRGGGIAIFTGFHAAGFFLFLFPYFAHGGIVDLSWWMVLCAASSSLLVVGLMDDIYRLSRAAKLAGQSIAATFLFASGLSLAELAGWALPLWLDYPGTVAFFLLIAAAFRSLGGIEGVTAGSAGIAAAGIAATLAARGLHTEALSMAGLSGACAGFLFSGLAPARIALGESGGMLLGFSLAGMILATAGEGGRAASAIAPLFVLAVPLVDLGLTVWRRGVRHLLSRLLDQELSLSSTSRDSEHIHHRLLESGRSSREACMIMFLFGALAAAVGAVCAFSAPGAHVLVPAMGLAVVLFALHFAAAVELPGTALAVVYMLGRQTKPLLARSGYLALSLAAFSASYAPAAWLARFGPHGAPAPILLPVLLCCVLPALLCLEIGGRSGRCGIASPSRCVLFILAMSGLNFWFLTAGSGVSALEAAIECLIFAGLACGAAQALALLPRAVESCILYEDARAARCNVLLCGSPGDWREYVDETGGSSVVIGIVSGSPIETERSATGEPSVLGEVNVLGEIKDIPRLIASHCIHEIVLAGELTREARREVRRLAGMHSVPVSEWSGVRSE